MHIDAVKTSHPHRNIAVGERGIAKLARRIVAPAIDGTARDERTRVIATCTHC